MSSGADFDQLCRRDGPVIGSLLGKLPIPTPMRPIVLFRTRGRRKERAEHDGTDRPLRRHKGADRRGAVAGSRLPTDRVVYEPARGPETATPEAGPWAERWAEVRATPEGWARMRARLADWSEFPWAQITYHNE